MGADIPLTWKGSFERGGYVVQWIVDLLLRTMVLLLRTMVLLLWTMEIQAFRSKKMVSRYWDDFDSIERGSTYQGYGEVDMNKGCEKYSVELSAFFDGELESEEKSIMEAHLETCEGCRHSLGRLKQLHGALASLSAPPLRQRSILDEIKSKLNLDEEEEDDPISHLC